MNGPIYCETGHPWHGIAEPVNFFTNGFCIVAAMFATRLMLRSDHRRDVGLWVLVVLLYAVGIGSALWHGMRTTLTLILDTVPGVLFLLVLVGLWFARLYGKWVGWIAPVALVVAGAGGIFAWRRIFAGLPLAQPPFSVIPVFIAVTLTAAWLLIATKSRHSGTVAGSGLAAIACGLLAASARTLDPLACAVLPFGSHFLWHFFLSLAAYLAIVTMLRMKSAGAPATVTSVSQ